MRVGDCVRALPFINLSMVWEKRLAHLNIAVVWYLNARALVVGGPYNNEPQTVLKIVMKYQKVKKQCGKLDTILKRK